MNNYFILPEILVIWSFISVFAIIGFYFIIKSVDKLHREFDALLIKVKNTIDPTELLKLRNELAVLSKKAWHKSFYFKITFISEIIDEKTKFCPSIRYDAYNWWNNLPVQNLIDMRDSWVGYVQKHFPSREGIYALSLEEITHIYIKEKNDPNSFINKPITKIE